MCSFKYSLLGLLLVFLANPILANQPEDNINDNKSTNKTCNQDNRGSSGNNACGDINIYLPPTPPKRLTNKPALKHSSVFIGGGGVYGSKIKVGVLNPITKVEGVNSPTNVTLGVLLGVKDFPMSLGFDYNVFRLPKEIILKYKDSNSEGQVTLIDYSTFGILVNAKSFRANYFDISTQLGIGIVSLNTPVKVKRKSDNYSSSGPSTDITYKIGVVGNFYINDYIAIATGIHYNYIGEISNSDHFYGDNTLKIKIGNPITYNIMLKFLF